MGVLKLEPAHSRQQRVAQPAIGGIRLIREEDIPWGIDLAVRRYPNKFDFIAAEMWMRNIVLKQPWMFLPLRSDNAFVITLIATIPWLPSDLEANVVMVCAEPGCGWEALKMLRVSLGWARKRKCSEWRFRTETEFDIGPFAKRLGAVELPTAYAVRF